MFSVVAVVVIALLGFVAVKWLLGWLTGLGKPMTTIAAGFGSFIDKLGSAGIAISILGGLALVLFVVAYFLPFTWSPYVALAIFVLCCSVI